MSKDRIKFFLGKKYFQQYKTANGMTKSSCVDVLLKAFNMHPEESREIMASGPEGFTILCRPSQFARFIVYRCDTLECINGVRDLKPQLVDAMTHIKDISDDAGVSISLVTRVLNALEGGGAVITYREPQGTCIDVSVRPRMD